jgi:hypothetical protein
VRPADAARPPASGYPRGVGSRTVPQQARLRKAAAASYIPLGIRVVAGWETSFGRWVHRWHGLCRGGILWITVRFLRCFYSDLSNYSYRHSNSQSKRQAPILKDFFTKGMFVIYRKKTFEPQSKELRKGVVLLRRQQIGWILLTSS